MNEFEYNELVKQHKELSKYFTNKEILLTDKMKMKSRYEKVTKRMQETVLQWKKEGKTVTDFEVLNGFINKN